MSKYIMIVCLSLMCIAITGCGRQGTINFILGEPYFGGDDECVRYRQSYEQYQNKCIECYDEKDNFTGMRRAMTPSELQHYYFKKQMAAMEFNQFMNQIDHMNMMNAINRPINCFNNGFQTICY